MRNTQLSRLLVVAALALTASVVSAQTGSSIAGVVKDTTGAVLPGVTVEAASPALIEKVRTAVTDAAGQYKVVGLVPGTYTVTFTLTGFNAFKRENIELTSSFTANVNAELRIGAVEETITVSAESPTVDVQNVVAQRVMTRDILDSVPAGSKAVISVGILIPGVVTNNQDVGGTAYTSSQIAIHGGRQTEQQLLYDGMYYNNGQGMGGTYTAMAVNDGTVQEVSLETGGLSAESALGGIRTNVIPKEGGNSFKGSFFGTFTNESLQGDNLTPDLIARGLAATSKVTESYDVNPSVGGPVVRDRLWFFGSYRRLVSNKTVAGMFFNATPTGHVYTPDLSRPAANDEINGNQSVRLTGQLSPRNKISAQFQNAQRLIPGYGYALNNLLNTPEATLWEQAVPDYLAQVGWSSPVTSRLLFEAGAAFANKDYPTYTQPGVDPATPAFTDLGTGISWGNLTSSYGHNASHQFNTRFVASYVTGSHAAKFGVTFMHTSAHTTSNITNDGMTLQLLNGVPSRVTVFSTPLAFDEVMKFNAGLFAQDQWTIRHLTMNLGVRYDHYNAYVPAATIGPGPQVPGRSTSFPEVDNVPNWKDVSPRFGVSYDVFGNGKTAVKFNLAKYLEGPVLITYTKVAEPAGAIVQSATRPWNDLNHDFIPQASELGALSQSAFGTSVITTRYADDVPTTRGNNWEVSGSIQHELLPKVSVNAAYFRRWYGNLRVNQNTSVTSSDFSPYCITSPVDARLPGGGGSQLCGFFDVNPNRFGQSNTVVQETSHFGQAADLYDGIDLTTNVRLPRGVVAAGGVSLGRERLDSCYALNDLSVALGTAGTPRTQAYCDVRPPFQPNVKLLAVYPLPWWGLQAAATFQSLPGPQVTASYTATNAQIAPSLGRNLSSGANGTVAVDLIPPGTLYGDRLNQLDIRGTKIFKVGRSRIMANVDLYNLLNGNAVITQNNTFGTAWQRPTLILQPRLLKFGVQLDF